MTYGDFTLNLNDTIKDAGWLSTHVDSTLRATNNSLRDINVGEIGEPTNQEVGYHFQRKTVTIPYVMGTNSYVLALTDFKFPYDLRPVISNVVGFPPFSEVSVKSFINKAQTFFTQDKVYAISYNNNTLTIYINDETSENLVFEYYSTSMVLAADGVTFNDEISDNADTLLIPDRYMNVLRELVAAEIFAQTKSASDKSQESNEHLKKGQNLLKRMISAIGAYRKQPVERMSPRGEWPQPMSRVSTR